MRRARIAGRDAGLSQQSLQGRKRIDARVWLVGGPHPGAGGSVEPPSRQLQPAGNPHAVLVTPQNAG